MTREEIMANRILPKEVVDSIIGTYHILNYPSFEEIANDKDGEIDPEERSYISPEKVQRMPPEEVIDYLIESGYMEYAPKDTDGIMHVLAVATGRTEDELRNAIFGTGTFDAKKFYQPTDLQKKVIRFIFGVAPKLAEKKIGFNDYSKWPDKMKAEWGELVKQVPDAASDEFFGECNEYIKYYLKNGAPLWLY